MCEPGDVVGPISKRVKLQRSYMAIFYRLGRKPKSRLAQQVSTNLQAAIEKFQGGYQKQFHQQILCRTQQVLGSSQKQPSPRQDPTDLHGLWDRTGKQDHCNNPPWNKGSAREYSVSNLDLVSPGKSGIDSARGKGMTGSHKDKCRSLHVMALRAESQRD